MSKTEQKESKEVLEQVQEALFHIHSMANVLGMIIAENSGVIGEIKSMRTMVACPFISFTDMIREKAESCLEMLDEEIGI
jgi:hypothetical protein